jgi:hypothetical protein
MGGGQQEQRRLQELGDFLLTRRNRLAPEQIGLPSGGRRRTPGLRRAEVAPLAGVSVDWNTWLEQGRPITVSTPVLESLAQTLHLDANEREHLFFLAHQQPPPERRILLLNSSGFRLSRLFKPTLWSFTSSLQARRMN